MDSKEKKGILRKIVLHVLGAIVLLAGIILILLWWDVLVVVLKGVIGGVLALVGLAVLYYARQ